MKIKSKSKSITSKRVKVKGDSVQTGQNSVDHHYDDNDVDHEDHNDHDDHQK